MLLIGIAGTEAAAARTRMADGAGCRRCDFVLAQLHANRDQLIALVESIRDVAGEETLIAVDQEGGPVQRFREGFTRLPALARIGEVYDRDPAEAVRLAEEHAWVMASELRASGIDFSFAPVADLARGNAAIGTRAFHADPDDCRRIGPGLRARHASGRHGGDAQAFPGSWLGRGGYA